MEVKGRAFVRVYYLPSKAREGNEWAWETLTGGRIEANIQYLRNPKETVRCIGSMDMDIGDQTFLTCIQQATQNVPRGRLGPCSKVIKSGQGNDWRSTKLNKMAVLSYDKRSVWEWIIEQRAEQTKRTIYRKPENTEWNWKWINKTNNNKQTNKQANESHIFAQHK